MKHLLLVGNEHQTTRASTDTLHTVGYTTDTATNYTCAEELITTHAPDVVVLDLRTAPYTNVADLRAIPMLNDVPLLALLPRDNAGAPQDLDADLTLTEPFTDETFVATVNALQRSAPAVRTLRGRLRKAEAARDEIVATDRKKDEFFSLMSHELKNPMASIKGYADLMRRRIAKNPGDPNEKGLDIISQQVSRMTSLLDQLLDFSRINMDRLQLNRRPCNLVRVVQLAALNVQTTTDNHQIIEQIDINEMPAFVDDSRINQALTNLLTNAIKYSPEGGPIIVSVEAFDGQSIPTALISIADQGIGIAEEDQKHLFERFFRARNAMAISSGMGLGLFISHQIIAHHGGKIWIESQAGFGTTVRFTLPLDNG